MIITFVDFNERIIKIHTIYTISMYYLYIDIKNLCRYNQIKI